MSNEKFLRQQLSESSFRVGRFLSDTFKTPADSVDRNACSALCGLLALRCAITEVRFSNLQKPSERSLTKFSKQLYEIVRKSFSHRGPSDSVLDALDDIAECHQTLFKPRLETYMTLLLLAGLKEHDQRFAHFKPLVDCLHSEIVRLVQDLPRAGSELQPIQHASLFHDVDRS